MSESCYAPCRKWVLSSQQCRFYRWDKTHLCLLKDSEVKYVHGLEELGNPWCTNRSFLFVLPWWMPSASLFAMFRFPGPSSCHFSFLSSQWLSSLSFITDMSLSPTWWQGPWHLLTDLHVTVGFPDLPGQWVESTPDPLQRGSLFPFILSHLESAAFQDSELCNLLLFLLHLIPAAESLLPVYCAVACLSTISMAKLTAAAGTSKTPSPLSFYFSPEIFSGVDFFYLLCITPWLLSPVSIVWFTFSIWLC